jgi:hypothetical protein
MIVKCDKLIVVINGKGGSGKDTLANFVAEQMREGSAEVVSSITPIKEIAYKYGYSDDDKNLMARRFLSELKAVFIEWNDLPLMYLGPIIDDFLDTPSKKLLFVMIREPVEIKKFKTLVDRKLVDLTKEGNCPSTEIVTLLIKRPEVDSIDFCNESDDYVDNYNYDYIYNNDGDLFREKYKFMLFFIDNILSVY